MPPFFDQIRQFRILLWIGLAALLGAALCFIPLFDLLGYEFSAVMALFVSLAGAHTGSIVVANCRNGRPTALLAQVDGLIVVRKLVARSIALTLLYLLPPLIFICLNAFRVRNCNVGEGILFFVALPVISAVIAATMSVCWSLALRRPVLATAASLATVVVSLLLLIANFYFTPAIFAYDPFLGYFPGPLYDEDVALRGPFYWSRLYQLCWLALVVTLTGQLVSGADLVLRFRPLTIRRGWLLISLLLLIVSILITAGRDKLGITSSTGHLIDVLSGHHRTEHFDIHYPPELDPHQVERLVEDHEFRYQQLRSTLHADPGRIRSFIFASDQQKRRLMGAAKTLIAKPWRNEVYLSQQRFPHPLLKHELAHVFLGQFGDAALRISMGKISLPVLPIALPVPIIGLIEGVAVAVDWPAQEDATPHDLVRCVASHKPPAKPCATVWTRILSLVQQAQLHDRRIVFAISLAALWVAQIAPVISRRRRLRSDLRKIVWST